MSTSRAKKPTQIQLTPNDLDFYCLPERSSLAATRHNDLVCTVDCSRLFVNGAHHVVFALDGTGGQGSYNPHCGPIIRHGKNLWSEARVFIFFADGVVEAERWNVSRVARILGIPRNTLYRKLERYGIRA